MRKAAIEFISDKGQVKKCCAKIQRKESVGTVVWEESQVCGGGGYVLCPGKPLDHWNREGRRPEAGRLGRGSSSEGPSGKGADDLVDQDGMLGTQR